MAKDTEKVPVFDVDDLIKNSAALYGVQREVLKAALYDVKGPISKDGALKKLDAFLKRPITE